ncbi:serine hydrolase domain-containing protein [Larkinella rosea]|uniref:Serine hydrolase n=1 Tax=Larkinella rosea TaxID=2025312 RepID=A0A3P1BIH4_9BACT|nr:serine hydrolase domain-containing protein [Larkinella rosea]RRB00907.1 serine hydrolase [Larkinella rosea]
MKQQIQKWTLCFIALSAFFTGINPVFAQTADIETIIQREMKERRIPGLQLAVVQRGKIVLLKSYGIGNIQYSTPVTNQSVFSINSCTKAFTGVAVMQLVEEGKVDLAAPVSRYLGGLPATWQPVTIRQLLTHVSGLPDILRVIDSSPMGRVMDEETAWEKTKAMPMDFPTGTQFLYNQTNYALLGKIIEKFREKPFAEVFQERQLRVVGMPNTGLGDSRDVIPNKTQSYGYVTKMDGRTFPEGKLTNSYEIFPAFRRTASGMNSTAEDLARWIIGLQGGQLFQSKTTLNALWTPGKYNDGRPTQWAMGWVTKPRPQHSAMIATGGGRSAFFVYPEDELAIVVLTNLAGASPEEFIDELAGCYNPEIPKSDPITTLHVALRKSGFENAGAVYAEEKKKNPRFQPTETDLNDWAYRMMSRGQLKEALGIFKLNVDLFPESWNVYDSYGEALYKNGQKEDAIVMYKKSIALNADNQGGKQMLERILKTP